METNAVPRYDSSDNPTGCCPRFNPEGWDGQGLHFENKRFVKATTRHVFYIPLNMGSVFPKILGALQEAKAFGDDNTLVLSCNPSPWSGEHYFAVDKDVPGQEMATLSGDYLTKVFEGPFRDTRKWCREMEDHVASRGKQVKQTYYFYTTCPRCAKVYGKNYVVAVAEVE